MTTDHSQHAKEAKQRIISNRNWEHRVVVFTPQNMVNLLQLYVLHLSEQENLYLIHSLAPFESFADLLPWLFSPSTFQQLSKKIWEHAPKIISNPFYVKTSVCESS